MSVLTSRIAPCLWFDTEAEDAATFYTSVFKNSRVLDVSRYPEGMDRAGEVLTVTFELDGTQFVALNGGPEFTFDEAISFQIRCDNQAEVDEYWERLTAEGGEESQCGWLKDRFGLSWQVVPDRLVEILSGDDPGRASRAVQAMLTMRKIDIAAVEAAADAG